MKTSIRLIQQKLGISVDGIIGPQTLRAISQALGIQEIPVWPTQSEVRRGTSLFGAPGREDALPRLVRYRNIRNKMAHEIGSLTRANEVTKADVAWLRKFDKDIIKRKDPISAYLKRARRYARRRRIKKYLTVGAASLAVILGIIVFFLLKN
jgi:peptidoglycan hydrolase-like protein with peptidoglycan-binding domain